MQYLTALCGLLNGVVWMWVRVCQEGIKNWKSAKAKTIYCTAFACHISIFLFIYLLLFFIFFLASHKFKSVCSFVHLSPMSFTHLCTSLCAFVYCEFEAEQRTHLCLWPVLMVSGKSLAWLGLSCLVVSKGLINWHLKCTVITNWLVAQHAKNCVKFMFTFF